MLICRGFVCALKLSPIFWNLKPFWLRFSDIPYLGTFALRVPVSLLAARIWNLFIDAEARRESEVARHGDSLQQLMQDALREGHMVSITFENRKWYAGYVAQAPNLKPKEKHFRILPILSGYRDKDTLLPIRTISYADVYTSGVLPKDFVITLPLDAVATANLFDPAVYEDNFASPPKRRRRGLRPKASARN